MQPQEFVSLMAAVCSASVVLSGKKREFDEAEGAVQEDEAKFQQLKSQ